MPAKKRASDLNNLPQKPETWGVAAVTLRIWVDSDNGTPFRPWMVLVLDLEHGAIIFSELVQNEPASDEMYNSLVKAMRKPMPGGGRPRRPQLVICANAGPAEALIPALAAVDVDCRADELPMIPEIIAGLEAHMKGDEPEKPGLLSVEGVTPELVGAVFAAAADFYEAAPWVQLANEHTLAIRFPADGGRERVVVVMGNAGVEYGLSIYNYWTDVEQLFYGVDQPHEAIPPSGLLTLFFDNMSLMPFDDLDACQQYGWDIADDKAYPLMAIFERTEAIRRPNVEELKWLEAALRAIPLMVRDHLKPDGKGDYQPVEQTLTIPTHAGEGKVQVKHPAGVLDPSKRPANENIVDWDTDPDEEADEETPPFDRRLMEGMLADMALGMGAEPPSDKKLQKAQQLMYKAWEERNPAKRIALAHQAIATSNQCADAYVLLAEEQADTVARALEYYQQGLSAGERALGPEYFKNAVGDFWGLLETRPYMRARLGVADCLWKLGRHAEAIAHYHEMLRLNPGDNQGIRYILLSALVELDRDDESLRLLKKYKDDAGADWLFTWALIEFRNSGSGKAADRRLRDALKFNSHVPAYLTGRKRVPNRLPDYISLGQDSEAAHYADLYLNHWRRTPGAVQWLKSKL